MKKKYWLIIGIILIAISVLIYFATRPKKMNKFIFPNTLSVTNNTDYKALDTIIMVALNRVLSFDTMSVNVYVTPIDFSTADIDIIGYVMKNPFKAHTYNVFIKKKTDVNNILTFVAHEAIHIQQIEDGRLVHLNDSTNIYMNDTISLHVFPYKERPEEIDAFNKQNAFRIKLNELLYKKPS